MCPDAEPQTVYDAVKAKEFVAAGTGFDTALVKGVLGAEIRYLELDGIAFSEENDAVFREGALYRHLLLEPPTSSTIGNGSTWSLSRASA